MDTSSTVNFQTIVQPILDTIGLIIAGVITGFIPVALSAFQKRTGIALTAQQQDTMTHAALTAAGIVETKIDQGIIDVSHVTVSNPVVRAEAAAAIAAVPDTAKSLGMTPDGVARMIVGLVDTGSRTSAPAPSALTVPPDLPSAPVVPSAGVPPFVAPRPTVVLKSPAAPIPDQPAPSMWP